MHPYPADSRHEERFHIDVLPETTRSEFIQLLERLSRHRFCAVIDYEDRGPERWIVVNCYKSALDSMGIERHKNVMVVVNITTPPLSPSFYSDRY